MRRLFRIILRSLTVLSLLLCLATCELWVRGHSKADWFVWRVGNYDVSIYSEAEGTQWMLVRRWRYRDVRQFIHLSEATSWPPEFTDIEPDEGAADFENELRRFRPTPFDINNRMRGGFGFGIKEVKYPGTRSDFRAWHVITPSWTIPVFASILPSLWLCGRIRRRGSGRTGSCPTCGYDLRATPDRCPECGAAPSLSSDP